MRRAANSQFVAPLLAQLLVLMLSWLVLLLSWTSLVRTARADSNIAIAQNNNGVLLVRAEAEGAPGPRTTATARRLEQALTNAHVAVRVSPLTLEQLALAVGCNPTLDGCVARITREVAGRSVLIWQSSELAGNHSLCLACATPTRSEVPHISGISESDARAIEQAVSGLCAPRDSSSGLRESSLVEAGPELRTKASGEHAPLAQDNTPTEGLNASPSPAAALSGVSQDGSAEPPHTLRNARLGAAVALATSAALFIAGGIQLNRANDAAHTYDHLQIATRAEADVAHDTRSDAEHHQRLARALLGSASVSATAGVLALLWHRLRHTDRDSAQKTSLAAGAGPNGVMFALNGHWGGTSP